MKRRFPEDIDALSAAWKFAVSSVVPSPTQPNFFVWKSPRPYESATAGPLPMIVAALPAAATDRNSLLRGMTKPLSYVARRDSADISHRLGNVESRLRLFANP